jgi:hypothetical protein
MANTFNKAEDKKSFKKLESILSKITWELEDFHSFVGFSFNSEEVYSTGAFENHRCGIIDQRVLYKYPGGSRRIIEFKTVNEAVIFYESVTKLKVFRTVNKFKFPRTTKVQFLTNSEFHPDVDLIGKTGVVIDNIITNGPSICNKVPTGSNRVSVDISEYMIPIKSHPQFAISYLAVSPDMLKIVE